MSKDLLSQRTVQNYDKDHDINGFYMANFFNDLLSDIPGKISEIKTNKNTVFQISDPKVEMGVYELMAALLVVGDMKNVERLLEAANIDPKTAFKELSAKYSAKNDNTIHLRPELILHFTKDPKAIDFIIDNSPPMDMSPFNNYPKGKGLVHGYTESRMDVVQKMAENGAEMNKVTTVKISGNQTKITGNALDIFLAQYGDGAYSLRNADESVVNKYVETINTMIENGVAVSPENVLNLLKLSAELEFKNKALNKLIGIEYNGKPSVEQAKNFETFEEFKGSGLKEVDRSLIKINYLTKKIDKFVENGDLKELKKRFEKNEDEYGKLLNSRDKDGDTFLHKALRKVPVDTEVVKFLVSKGADLNIVNEKGETPQSIYHDKRMGLKATLQDTFQPKAPNDKTPIRQNSAPVIKEKSKEEIKPEIVKSKSAPKLGLEFFKRKSSKEVIVEKPDLEKEMVEAIKNGDDKKVEKLLDNKEILSRHLTDGKTVLHLLVENDMPVSLVKKAINNEADILKKAHLIVDSAGEVIQLNEGKTPMDIAIENGNNRYIEVFTDKLKQEVTLGKRDEASLDTAFNNTDAKKENEATKALVNKSAKDLEIVTSEHNKGKMASEIDQNWAEPEARDRAARSQLKNPETEIETKKAENTDFLPKAETVKSIPGAKQAIIDQKSEPSKVKSAISAFEAKAQDATSSQPQSSAVSRISNERSHGNSR